MGVFLEGKQVSESKAKIAKPKNKSKAQIAMLQKMSGSKNNVNGTINIKMGGKENEWKME